MPTVANPKVTLPKTRFVMRILPRLGLFVLSILFVFGCDKSPDYGRENESKAKTATIGHEAYSLLLQARFTAIKVPFDDSAEALVERRQQATRSLQFIKHSPELNAFGLDELWQEIVTLIDARADYLQQTFAISSVMKARENADSDAATREGWLRFFVEAAKEGKKEDGSPLPPTMEGLKAWYEEKEKRERGREDDGKAMMQSAANMYQRALTNFMAAAEAEANNVAKRLNLATTVTGFDSFANDVEFFRNNPQVSEGYVAKLRTWLDKRPDDPYLKSTIFVNMAVVGNISLENSLAIASECAALTAKLPDSQIFDKDKATFLSRAAEIIETKIFRDNEIEASWSNIREARALTAVKYRESAMKFGQTDVDGNQHVRIAWDLFMSGNLPDSYKVAEEARTEPNFIAGDGYCLKMAQLCSKLARFDEAMTWLERLMVGEHYLNVRFLRNDSDLQDLQVSRRAAFEDLLSVKWGWKIEFGVLNDDIILTNNSRIWLSNLVLETTITQGARKWTPALKVGLLGPGRSHKWENVISIPNSRIDKGSASLQCDQSEHR